MSRRRSAIRDYLFTAATAADGKKIYIPSGKLDGTLKGDGSTWRIKIGDSSVDEKAVVLMGGGSIVGNIPRGLPSFGFPGLDLNMLLKLLPIAVIISLLGFMEAISIAKAMAAKTGQRLDANQELIGQGIANIMGAFTRSFPVSGSFSRSAVNIQSGALTGLSSVVTSITVAIVLLFFTPLLYYLPQSVLAAVIMMAVIGLINVSGFIHAWKAQWYDGLFSIITFLATLITAPHLDKGIMIGVLLSVGMFLYKSMRPKVTTLSMHEDSSFQSARDHGLKGVPAYCDDPLRRGAVLCQCRLSGRKGYRANSCNAGTQTHSHCLQRYKRYGRLGGGNALAHCGSGEKRRLRDILCRAERKSACEL